MKVSRLTAKDIVSLARDADRKSRYKPTALAGVVSCQECFTLVLEAEDHRGMHHFWHLSLDDTLHEHDQDEDQD